MISLSDLLKFGVVRAGTDSTSLAGPDGKAIALGGGGPVVASTPPISADGKPDGTVYIQTGVSAAIQAIYTKTAGVYKSMQTGLSPALRPVTDRGALADSGTGGTNMTFMQSRSAQIAHDVLTKPVVEWTLAMVSVVNENVGNCTANIISSSIEYPQGTFTQLKYGGSATATINGTSILSSDPNPLSVAIPDGAQFWVWIYMQYTSSDKAYYSDGMANNLSGEAQRYQETPQTDFTMTGGLVTQNGDTSSFRPVCIRDISSKLTAYVMGDSRQRRSEKYGHVSGKGRTGEANRAVGARMAMINGAVSGDSYAYAKSPGAYTLRKQLSDRCDIIIDEYGINDLGPGTAVSVATFAGFINSMRALLGPTKPYYRQTITARTTSTDNWLTTTGQTVTVNLASRNAINDAIRTNTLPLNNPMAGYFETADAIETTRNSGIIKPLSGRVLTDVTVAAYGNVATTASPQFSAADVGKVLVASQGSVIISFISPTQVRLGQALPTAVAPGANVYMGVSTRDGLHFLVEAEVLMAADPSWNQLGPAVY